MDKIKSAIEAILFIADTPLAPRKIADIVDVDEKEVLTKLMTIRNELKAEDKGWQLRETAGGYRLYTHPQHAEIIESFMASPGYRRLTQAGLEVLAIIAYRQPVTRAAVADIRGVNSDSAIISLVDKGLIEESGHEDSPGQATLYKTSKLFLEKFGLNTIADLPDISEFLIDDDTAAKINSRLNMTEASNENPFKALVD